MPQEGLQPQQAGAGWEPLPEPPQQALEQEPVLEEALPELPQEEVAEPPEPLPSAGPGVRLGRQPEVGPEVPSVALPVLEERQVLQGTERRTEAGEAFA